MSFVYAVYLGESWLSFVYAVHLGESWLSLVNAVFVLLLAEDDARKFLMNYSGVLAAVSLKIKFAWAVRLTYVSKNRSVFFREK